MNTFKIRFGLFIAILISYSPPLCHAGADAKKLIFAGDGSFIYPLAILEDGYVKDVPFGQMVRTMYGPDRVVLFEEYHVGAKYFSYVSGQFTGSVVVKSLKEDLGGYGNPNSATVEAENKMDFLLSNNFVTSYALNTKPMPEVTSNKHEDIGVVKELLRERFRLKEVPNRLIKDLIRSCKTVATSLSRDGSDHFISTCSYGSKKHGVGGYSSLSIIQWPSHGKPSVVYFEGLSANPYEYGDDEYLPDGGYEYLDKADLSGDGIDEVLIHEDAGEAYLILQYIDGEWKKAAYVQPGFITE